MTPARHCEPRSKAAPRACASQQGLCATPRYHPLDRFAVQKRAPYSSEFHLNIYSRSWAIIKAWRYDRLVSRTWERGGLNPFGSKLLPKRAEIRPAVAMTNDANVATRSSGIWDVAPAILIAAIA
jgi:hypothetical protein